LDFELESTFFGV